MKFGIQADRQSNNGTEQKDNDEAGLSFYRAFRGSRRQCETVPPGPWKKRQPSGRDATMLRLAP